MAQAGSAKDFGTAFIPLVLNLVVPGLDAVTGSRNATLIQMGQAQNQLPSPNPAFGWWVNSHPAFQSLQGNYSLKDMSGLYGALMNSSAFGPFTNPTLLAQCLNTSRLPTKDCGLAINIGAYIEAIQKKIPQITSFVRPAINSLLCPDPSSACFDTTNNATIQAIGLFIAEQLPKFVLGYLERFNYGLTTTRKQNEITLGYLMDKLRFPQYPQGLLVPGSVTSHTDETLAKKLGTNSTFYTCESTAGDRFTYAGT